MAAGHVTELENELVTELVTKIMTGRVADLTTGWVPELTAEWVAELAMVTLLLPVLIELKPELGINPLS